MTLLVNILYLDRSMEDNLNFYSPKSKYGYFSNFYPAPFGLNGVVYPTSEHYFQSMKYPHNLDYQRKVASAKTPGLAFKMARTKDVARRVDWE